MQYDKLLYIRTLYSSMQSNSVQFIKTLKRLSLLTVADKIATVRCCYNRTAVNDDESSAA